MRLDPGQSSESRGVDGTARLRRAVFAIGYVALASCGVLGLAYVAAGEVEGGLVAWLCALLVVIAVGGLATVGVEEWSTRHRAGVVLGVAPSGAPATVVPRSRSDLVLGVAVTSALVVLLGAGSLALAAAGSGWVVFTAAVAGLLAWPLVPAARGKVRPGGLYLTSDGVEHRRGALLWSVPWADVSGAVPGEPVAIVLAGRSGPLRTTTTPVVWNREVTAPPGVVGVDCRLLGLDGVLVAAAVNRAVSSADRRDELGTPASLAWPELAPPE